VADVHHDSEELRAGSPLGPYDLLAPIGVGGMARVWAARVRGKTDIVALKMLLPELAENVEFRKMFFDEARIASRVRHPNVCGTFEMGEQQGTLYLAMEWLDGPSLMRVLRPGREDLTECERIPIRPRIAARIVADACAGLHAAHELVGDDGRPLAVVHRDVSPHNLLLTSTGEVKITDFGVAKALGKSHMTIAGQLKGKLAYMAPEQLTGGQIDRRCDVFALGCVLYEVTTGQRPFQGEHDPQVMAAIMMGRYEPPSAIVPSYPHELAIIVMRALANEAENRFASAEQMRQALERYLRGSGPQVGQVQVAALIQERCGAEVQARAAAIRGERPTYDPRSADTRTADARSSAWPPPTVAASGSGSSPMMMEGGRPSSRRGLVWVALAALIGAALGVVVVSYVKTTRRAKAALAAAAADAAPLPAISATGPRKATTAEASTFAASDGGAGGVSMAAGDGGSNAGGNLGSTVITPISQSRVHLHISPSTAIVIVDGVVLPRGTDTIAKPTDGTSMNVLVRADRYEDTIVLVDSATPGDVDVSLVRRARSSNGAGITKDSGAGTAPVESAPAIDAPPNPYE
jgi:hypothetical protein